MPADASFQPLMAAHLLRAGHGVAGTRLLGHDLVVWRSADGRIQVWDDRCPHRSVRLSLGQVVGDRLACAYHGWEYEAGSARCVAIPALASQPVPGRVCARPHAALERDGMVWAALGQPPDAQDPALLPARASEPVQPAGPTQGSGQASGPTSGTTSGPTSQKAQRPQAAWLRGLGLCAAPQAVRAQLSRLGFGADPHGAWHGLAGTASLRLFVQPCDAQASLLHAWLLGPRDTADAAFAWLRALRAALEAPHPGGAGA